MFCWATVGVHFNSLDPRTVRSCNGDSLGGMGEDGTGMSGLPDQAPGPATAPPTRRELNQMALQHRRGPDTRPHPASHEVVNLSTQVSRHLSTALLKLHTVDTDRWDMHLCCGVS